jgi:hypothetical protein|tara:strand:+ start:3849 stop:3992 length:144 start_codon:yes stop_codon:yes gene_type:complete
MTLPWMNKLRQWKEEGQSDASIVKLIMAYGLSEEKRINKAFETGDKE